MKTSELVTWNCKSFTNGFLGFRPIENREIKLQSKNSYMAVTKSSKSYKPFHTILVYNLFSMGIKYMKTSDLIAWNCKSFTYWFLGFDPQSIRTWNYRVIHHIFLSPHPQNHRISLIQIWYKTTSRLKPKSMKTSDTRAWVCKLFIHVFMIFWHTEHV